MQDSAQASARVTWALVLLVDVVLFLPRLWFRNPTAGGADGRPRVGGFGLAWELGLLLALLALTAGTRWRRPLYAFAVVLFAAFFLVSFYHEAYMQFVFIGPAIVDDWRLIVNLFHFIRSASIGWMLASLATLVGYGLAIALVAATFRRFQVMAAGVPLRTRAAGAVAIALAGPLLWATHVPALERIVQPLSDGIVANVRTSRAALASERAIWSAPPDTRYDRLAALPLARRPNVYLLMIEAYGQLLATCPSQTEYGALLERIGDRLAASGLHARSGYSTAPIYGARSWLSMASVQTGIHIDAQPVFRELEKGPVRIPTLTSFFQTHGYYTAALQPFDRPRFGVTDQDIYRRDRLVTGLDVPYHGPAVGLAGIPDQFSLGWFDEHVLRDAPEPRFVFYMAVSTHFAWWSPGPFVRDYRQLDGDWAAAEELKWEGRDGRAAVTDPLLRDYLSTVEYEWRVLADFIEAHKSEDALFVIVGDHQPTRISCAGVPVKFDTPFHVLSRDAALLDRFADVGLAPGLYASPPNTAQLRHEGIYSLLVSKLTAQDVYAPAGAAPSGLRR
jgi:hypothetical protein